VGVVLVVSKKEDTGSAFPDLLSSSNGNGSVTGTDSKQNDLFPDLLDEQDGVNPNNASTSTTPTSQSTSNSTSTNNTSSNNNSKERMSIKELRAIAHGAGYNTRGMERTDLEKIAKHYAPVSSKIPAPVYKAPATTKTSTATPTASTTSKQDPPDRKDQEAEEKRIRQQKEYVKSKTAQEVKRKEQEVREKIQREANAARHARQTAQQQQQQQRPMWNGTKTSNPGNGGNGIPSPGRATRRPFDHNVFESNRFFGNASSSRPSRPSASPTSNSQQHQQQQSYGRPQQSPRPTPSAPPPPQQHHQKQQQNPTPPPPPPAGDPTSPISHKYAKAMKSQDDEQAVQTTIKRNILLTWALVPPTYNMLKPIDQLLTSIHIAFPPAFGVASHAYFSKWKAIAPSDLIMNLSTMGNAPDESKLKKGVRKLRVFLHPDKLPRDLNVQQKFVCKMLWDVTNDAWEEFVKQKEQLDWVHN